MSPRLRPLWVHKWLQRTASPVQSCARWTTFELFLFQADRSCGAAPPNVLPTFVRLAKVASSHCLWFCKFSYEKGKHEHMVKRRFSKWINRDRKAILNSIQQKARLESCSDLPTGEVCFIGSLGRAKGRRSWTGALTSAMLGSA